MSGLRSLHLLRRAAGAGLLLLAAACSGGRDFKEPRTIAEWRPTRPVTAAGAAEDNDAFRAAPPARLSAKPRTPVMPTEVRLSNGVRVVMLERHDFPVVSAVLVLDRGATAGGPGVAALYTEAMVASSAEYKSSDAWQYLNFVGATVRHETWRDGLALEVSALSPLFVSALSRTVPMFTAPALKGDELDEARTHLAAASASKDEDPSDVAYDALYAAVFPAPHPYGTPVSGEPARLRGHAAGAQAKAESKVTNDAVKAFLAANVAAEHVGVAVVGDFKPDSMQRVLEKSLGKLPKRSAAEGTAAPAVSPIPAKGGRKIIVIDRPGAAQSNVAIGWPGPRASEPDLVTLDVLAGATAGTLSTRLNITVRKELGATYGVHMWANGLREAGLVQIGAAIDTPRTIDALRGLFKELERLRTEPLSPAELGAAKLRTYAGLDNYSARGLARYLGRAIAEGLPPAHVVMHDARVDVVTAEGVRAAAERYLTNDEVRVVIVGDASRIVDGLRTLGIGDVSVASAASTAR